MVGKKPHPLKGRKLSPETIAKRLATLAAKRAAYDPRFDNSKAWGKPEKRKYTKRQVTSDTRTHEQLQRDVKEAIWCLGKSVASTRRKIAAGELSLTEVTDEETFQYMAMRYLQGGLR